MIFSWLKPFTETITHFGVARCKRPSQAKKIILTNQIALGMGIGCLPYFFMYKQFAMPTFGMQALFFSLGYFLIPFINRLGGINFSRLLLMFIGSVAISTSAVSLGKSTGIHLFLIPLAWVSLILFEWEERKSILVGIAFTSILLLAIELFGNDTGFVVQASPTHLKQIHFSVLVTLLISQILVVYVFTKANRRNEAALSKVGNSAQAADKAKSQFLANMSHEIRTPLNSIIGMSNLLMEAKLDQEQGDLVQAIQSSGMDLMNLISEILDLSKIEAGKMRLDEAIFELQEAIQLVKRPFMHEAHWKKLNFVAETNINSPTLVIGDAGRLKQVLNNLLGNAIKFTKSGSVTLRVDQLKGASNSAIPTFRFEVEDTGLGIPLASQHKIFQSFSQVPESSENTSGGTGLGLFISKQIVEMMGGRIGFTSTYNRGSCFYFEIPFKTTVPPKNLLPVTSTLQSPKINFADVPVLIVEDHPLNQKVLAGFLSQFDCDIDTANNGQEALIAIEKKNYRIVFMDCHMPGMDGYECTRTIRILEKEKRQTVIIGVTADAMLGIKEKCLAAGMNDVLTKPILTAELDRILNQWLAAEQLERKKQPQSEIIFVNQNHLKEMDEWIKSYDPQFWVRTIAQFRSSSHRLIRVSRDALATNNLNEVKESMHALKGLCLMMGLSHLSDICNNLDKNDENTSHATCDQIINELENAIEPSLAALSNQVLVNRN